jgi:hypothetical protein
MTFRIILKDPDGYYERIRAVAIDSIENGDRLSHDEFNHRVTYVQNELDSLLSQWFQFREYLTLEVDTDNETLTIVPVDNI